MWKATGTPSSVIKLNHDPRCLRPVGFIRGWKVESKRSQNHFEWDSRNYIYKYRSGSINLAENRSNVQVILINCRKNQIRGWKKINKKRVKKIVLFVVFWWWCKSVKTFFRRFEFSVVGWILRDKDVILLASSRLMCLV